MGRLHMQQVDVFGTYRFLPRKDLSTKVMGTPYECYHKCYHYHHYHYQANLGFIYSYDRIVSLFWADIFPYSPQNSECEDEYE
jgi:hypothetical protein